MLTEEQRTKKREYMRRYNATPKGAAYNRMHSMRWRKATKAWLKDKSRLPRAVEYRQAIVEYLFRRDGIICKLCGGSMDGPNDATLNHRVPVALGGTNTLENYELAHGKCNFNEGVIVRKLKHGH